MSNPKSRKYDFDSLYDHVKSSKDISLDECKKHFKSLDYAKCLELMLLFAKRDDVDRYFIMTLTRVFKYSDITTIFNAAPKNGCVQRRIDYNRWDANPDYESQITDEK